jgi:arylsulfatase A-like enzyme
VLTDDQGWGEAGFRGHPWLRTPELDAMAASGMELTRFYAAAPVCSPTRASLLTGRHPLRSRVVAWGHELPPEELTVAELLGDAGYRTGHFGKWHLGSVRAGEATSPGGQGFDTWASSPNFFDLSPRFSVNGLVERTEGEGSDRAMDYALDFITECAAGAEPFLAVVWLGSPHDPHQATAADLAAVAERGEAPEETWAYLAELEAVDRNVGRLRRALREQGVADETVVWFTSDNGPRAPGAAKELATGGLRGQKGTLYEGGLRVPCLVEWPGRIAAGSRSSGLSVTSDWLPTLLDWAGVQRPEEAPPLDGLSLTELLSGAPWERPEGIGFWTVPGPGRGQWAERILEAIENGEVHPSEAPLVVDVASYRVQLPPPDELELAPDPPPAYTGEAAWIEWPWKLRARETREGLEVALYDLERDPGELHDVAGENPIDRIPYYEYERLLMRLLTWQGQVELDARRRP